MLSCLSVYQEGGYFSNCYCLASWISYATNIHIQSFVWLHVSSGLGYVFGNRMLFRMILLYFSVRNSMETCGYLRGRSKVWNGCFIMCSHQQNVRRTISLPPFQQSLCVALVLLGSMKAISWWFGVAVSQQNSVTICISSLESYLFRPLYISSILLSPSYLSLFMDFWYNFLIRHIALQVIYLIQWLQCYFSDGVLWNANV